MAYGTWEVTCYEPLTCLAALHGHKGKIREQKTIPLQSIHHVLPTHFNLQGTTLLSRGGKITTSHLYRILLLLSSVWSPGNPEEKDQQYLSWRANLTLDKANPSWQVWLLSVVKKILWRENGLYLKCIWFVFQMHLNSCERPCKAGCPKLLHKRLLFFTN